MDGRRNKLDQRGGGKDGVKWKTVEQNWQKENIPSHCFSDCGV